MEWRADRERDRTLGPQCLGPLDRAADGRVRAGNHHLPRSVQVGRRDHVALSRLFARAGHGRGVQPQHGRHRAGAYRHGLLHVASATPDDPQRVGKRQRAGRDMRGVLAETVPGHERRRHASGRQRAPDRHADGEDRRLRVLGEHEPILGPVEAQAAQGLAQRGIGLGHGGPALGIRLGPGLAHADLLGPLPRKQECNHNPALPTRTDPPPAETPSLPAWRPRCVPPAPDPL